jgi:hypothetical protein
LRRRGAVTLPLRHRIDRHRNAPSAITVGAAGAVTAAAASATRCGSTCIH